MSTARKSTDFLVQSQHDRGYSKVRKTIVIRLDMR